MFLGIDIGTSGVKAVVLDEHGAILDAFRVGDGEAAERAIRQHLEGGRRRLLSGPPVASAPDADGSSA